MDQQSIYLISRRLAAAALAERYQRAKAALAEADPFYTSEASWKAFEEGGIDEFQVAKLEAMVKAYQDKEQSSAPVPDDPIGQLLDKYDFGEVETIQDLVDEVEALGTETGSEDLLDLVRAYRRFQQEDWELAGRGDSDEAEENLIDGLKRARGTSASRGVEGGQ